MSKGRVWFVCDCFAFSRNETPCIYDESSVEKLKSDPIRCIKHGALLFSSARHDGMSREQVRREVDGKE